MVSKDVVRDLNLSAKSRGIFVDHMIVQSSSGNPDMASKGLSFGMPSASSSNPGAIASMIA